MKGKARQTNEQKADCLVLKSVKYLHCERCICPFLSYCFLLSFFELFVPVNVSLFGFSSISFSFS